MCNICPYMPRKVKIFFEFPGGRLLEADRGFLYASGFIQKLIQDNPSPLLIVSVHKDVSLDDLRVMNKFVKVLRENFMEDIKMARRKKDHWMGFLQRHAPELEFLQKRLHKDDLITGANAGTYLECAAFISFCTYFLSERSKHLPLGELRKFLNADADFDESLLRAFEERVILHAMESKEKSMIARMERAVTSLK